MVLKEFAAASVIYASLLESAPDWGVTTSEKAAEWANALAAGDPAAWKTLNQDMGADADRAGVKPENFEVPGSMERVAALLAVCAIRDALLMAEGTARDMRTLGL